MDLQIEARHSLEVERTRVVGKDLLEPFARKAVQFDEVVVRVSDEVLTDAALFILLELIDPIRSPERSTEVIRPTIDAGASDYLTKPVDIEQLLSLMQVWLYR